MHDSCYEIRHLILCLPMMMETSVMINAVLMNKETGIEYENIYPLPY